MSTRELILLSPYRLPTQDTLYLGDEDVSAFLNGYVALWHPAAIQGASGPPRISSPYDHEQPTGATLYSTPTQPPLLLPDDWPERVRTAGAAAFQATPDRAETLANLLQALREQAAGQPELGPLLDLAPERVAPFLGIGFGFAQVDALFEAMSHEKLLDVAGLWQDVQQAVQALADPDPNAYRVPLQAAADKLLSAREVLYPVTVHVIDLGLLDEDHLDRPWPAAFDRGQPLNLIASAALVQRLNQEQPERFAALRERVSSDLVEVCGGCALEREDALLPLESQLWNLLKGQGLYEELLGQCGACLRPQAVCLPSANAAAAAKRGHWSGRAAVLGRERGAGPSVGGDQLAQPGRQAGGGAGPDAARGGIAAGWLPPGAPPLPHHHAGPGGHAGLAASRPSGRGLVSGLA